LLAILVFAGASVGAVSGVASLPNIYRSTATVLVEGQQVPETLVKPTVTSELETRLHTISQKILSRGRLEDLITRLDLHPEMRMRKNASLEEVIKRVRSDIEVEFKGIEQRWGRRATTAFTIGYRGRQPETVALVTNTLASFYIEENVKTRERQATGTAEFLRGQLQEVKQRLDAVEQRVSAFKKHHLGELPQQLEANLAVLERLNAQLRLNSENQTRAIERREGLVKQLAGAHSSPGGAGGTAERLAKLRRELTELKTRFSDSYPDVIQVKAEIAALEGQLAGANHDGSPEMEPAASVDPYVLRLREILAEAEAEIKALKGEEKGVRQTIATYQRRIENAPQREQEFQELSRDYGATKELYDSLSKRYEEAQLAESMEEHEKGEQFRSLDPAVVPQQPAAPKRMRLLVLGLMLSLGMAVGAVLLAEQLDTTFHSLDDLRAFTTVPVLVSIPKIVTAADALRQHQRVRLVMLSAVLGLILIAGAAYFFARGNEHLVLFMTRRGF
jgi:polysaccharide chain length determinant protein (PEP-CTERM system associated)